MSGASSVDFHDLFQAFSKLRSEEEFANFLTDLCTPKEIEALNERWSIVLLLQEGKTYRDIRAATGSSLSTITRVARFLHQEQYQGYQLVLNRLKASRRKG